MDAEVNRVLRDYDNDIKRDLWEIKTDKDKFIREVKSGLGNQMMDFNSYKKKKPSRWKKFWVRVKRVLWNA